MPGHDDWHKLHWRVSSFSTMIVAWLGSNWKLRRALPEWVKVIGTSLLISSALTAAMFAPWVLFE
jgi:hypothetical protein